MCGRFTQTYGDEIFDYFPVMNREDGFLGKTYNAAPSQKVLALAGRNGEYKAGSLTWGLIPSWSKKRQGTGFINARAETIAEKPSFKHLLDRKRCLILADSFYEWKKTESGKIPYRFMLRSGNPFAFAGLWDRWRDEEDELVTCTVITTAANERVKDIHDRMPVILEYGEAFGWLELETEKAVRMLRPLPAEEMKAYQVSTLINSAANNEQACINSVRNFLAASTI
ncbi:SOS response-associated peptidase [Bacillus sp. FJAT-42376]|uniref:SOS response-associated peptidase n=1 Tax=Bacillus sp. FJAT-42376 TaxID=2014076 RepID=UPI000F5010E7|nr:SOS response-associated peptidase [Bacillus sp. FJAT-42376]AZB43248.1 SOS response-associated peptidase [Bacillus sp. FJAT-42376]